METLPRFSQRLLLPIPLAARSLLRSPTLLSPLRPIPFLPSLLPSTPTSRFSDPVPASAAARRLHTSSTLMVRAGWLSRHLHRPVKHASPDIVQAGDPVLHEPAQCVDPAEIASDRIQKIIDDMVVAMRKGPGVGLAAPQIGIPLRIIVLEDKKLYISYVTKEEAAEQDRRPFDLLVIVNPKLKAKGNKTALFFEGCLSVEGYRAVVERHLEVEVAGLDRNGLPIKLDASGWQARILQHECDHLDGTLYVDKMTPKTFRTVENLDLPLANGSPKLGVH